MTEPSDAVKRARQRRATGAMDDFDGKKLSLARRLAKTSRTSLAAAAHVSAAAITQFERNDAKPTNSVVASLALTLGLPKEFFQAGLPTAQIPTSAAHFRSLRATSASSREQALAFAELAYSTVEALESYLDFPPVDMPDIALYSDAASSIPDIAAEVRSQLDVPAGPIGSMVRLLEARGVIVLRLPPQTVDDKVDAFSTGDGSRPLVILSSTKDDKARSRFDAAHELGHLVMHRGVEPGSQVVETEAHVFASNFLMPADEIVHDLPRRLDWDMLLLAKRKWGVSLAALVHRARDLDMLSDLLYQRANRMLRTEGYPERGSLGAPEQPSLLQMAMELLDEEQISFEEFASDNRLPELQTRLVIAAGSEQRKKLVVSD